MSCRLVRRVRQFCVEQFPNSFDGDRRFIAIELVHSIGDVACLISQENAPVRSIRPSLRAQNANESVIGDPCSQNLARRWVAFDF